MRPVHFVKPTVSGVPTKEEVPITLVCDYGHHYVDVRMIDAIWNLVPQVSD